MTMPSVNLPVASPAKPSDCIRGRAFCSAATQMLVQPGEGIASHNVSYLAQNAQGCRYQFRRDSQLHTPPELVRLLDMATDFNSLEGSIAGRSTAILSCKSQSDYIRDNISEVETDSTVDTHSELEDSFDSSLHASESSCSSQTAGSPRRLSNSGSSGCHSTPICGGSAKYWSSKPMEWFKEVVDAEGLGRIDFRRFLAALRRHHGLQCVLVEAAGIPFSGKERASHKQLHLAGPLGLSVPERTDILLQERARIGQIFKLMCDDTDSTLDMTGFLDFFYSRGLILDTKNSEN